MAEALCRATTEVPFISLDISQKLTNILPEGVGLGADGVDQAETGSIAFEVSQRQQDRLNCFQLLNSALIVGCGSAMVLQCHADVFEKGSDVDKVTCEENRVRLSTGQAVD